MAATEGRYEAEHLGVTYSFCSHQCLENFRARPGLYAGDHAPKKSDQPVIKQRRFRLTTSLTPELTSRLTGTIEHMTGIHSIRIEGSCVEISYDLMQVTAEQIEHRLAQAGARPGNGWVNRLRSGWIHYIEENELDNLAEAPGACCNRPPPKG